MKTLFEVMNERETRLLSTMLDWLSMASLLGASLIILLLLAGCSHMPLGSMAKVARLDPMTMDPAHLKVAVRGPAWLRVAPNSAKLILGANVPGKPMETINERFILHEMPQSHLPAQLENEVAGAERVALFRLNPKDLPRLYETQEAVRILRQKFSRKLEGSLTIDVEGCLTGPVPKLAGAPRTTVYLHTNPAEGFFPLIRNYDMRKVAGGKDFADLPFCANDKG